MFKQVLAFNQLNIVSDRGFGPPKILPCSLLPTIIRFKMRIAQRRLTARNRVRSKQTNIAKLAVLPPSTTVLPRNSFINY